MDAIIQPDCAPVPPPKLLSITDAIALLGEQIACVKIDEDSQPPTAVVSKEAEEVNLSDPVFKQSAGMPLRVISRPVHSPLRGQLMYCIPLGLVLDESESKAVFATLNCFARQDLDPAAPAGAMIVSGVIQYGLVEFTASGELHEGVATVQEVLVPPDFNLVELRWVSASKRDSTNMPTFLLISDNALALLVITHQAHAGGGGDFLTHDFTMVKSPINAIHTANVIYGSVHMQRYIGLILKNDRVYTACLINALDLSMTLIYNGVPTHDGKCPQCIDFFPPRVGSDEVCYAVSYKDTSVDRFSSVSGRLESVIVGPMTLPHTELTAKRMMPRFKSSVVENGSLLRCGEDAELRRIALGTQHNSYMWIPAWHKTQRPGYITMRDDGAAHDVYLGRNYTLIYLRSEVILVFDNCSHKRLTGLVESRVSAQYAKAYADTVESQTPKALRHQCDSCNIPVLKPCGGIAARVLYNSDRSVARILVLDKYGMVWASVGKK
jgi:hypothetical protein